MSVASLILWTATVYAAAGFVFAFAFVVRGAATIDRSAEGAPLSFRLLIFPGAAALWPILLRKWMSA